MSQFSVELFCLTVPKNSVREPFFALFQKIPVAKQFMDKKTRSIKTFRRKILCVTLPKTFVGEPFSVSIFLGHRKTLCFRGLCHDFPSNVFCLTVPKHFVEETF